MMNSGGGGVGSSSSGPKNDKNNNEFNFDFDFDLDTWINELNVDTNGELMMMNYGVDSTTSTPNYQSQTTISTINGGSNFGGSSANQVCGGSYIAGSSANQVCGGSYIAGSSSNQVSGGSNIAGSSAYQYSTQPQGGIFHDIITASRMTGNNSTAAVLTSGQILPDVPKFASTSGAQTSQPRRTTDFPQNQPMLQQVFMNNSVQQPPTHSSSSQSNIPFGGQKNQLHYHMPSNQLLPCTRPVVNTRTRNVQNNQPRRQIQQNPKQKQLQLPQGPGTSSNSLSVVKKNGKTHVDFSTPVGFSAPGFYPSSLLWREYVLSQIRIMRERFFKELRTMHYNAEQFHNQAKNVEAAKEYGIVVSYLAKMVAFLSITKIEDIPQNDDRVYNYMNVVVNYMNYHRNKARGSSQHNPPSNSSQGNPNSEANMVNFNQNFPSRKPRARGRMPGAVKNTSLQINPKPRNPLQSGSFKAPQGIVLSTTQQINSGTNTSSVNRSVSLFSNTRGPNVSSRPINHQPPVANQNNLEKLKQPMHKPNEFFLPPAGKSISQQTSPQWSPLPIPSSSFDVNTLLSPEAIARSPFLLSSPSTQSGGSPLSSLGSEKLKEKVNPPCPEKNQEPPQHPKDAFSHLVEVANSVSPKSLGLCMTDINSAERVMDYVPPNDAGSYMLDDGDIRSVYDNDVQSQMNRNLNVSSVSLDQEEFYFDDWDIFLSETPVNKKPRIENEWTILEEIKEINSKLLETSMHVVTEDDIMIVESEKGTIVKCVFKNVCFPDLRGSAAYEKMPDFVLQLLVPINYPVSSPTILTPGRNVLSEPWEMMYGETMTKFDLLLREVPGQISLGDMAKNWNASVRSVMTEFVEKRGGKSFTLRNGSWEICINSSSGSNLSP